MWPTYMLTVLLTASVLRQVSLFFCLRICHWDQVLQYPVFITVVSLVWQEFRGSWITSSTWTSSQFGSVLSTALPWGTSAMMWKISGTSTHSLEPWRTLKSSWLRCTAKVCTFMVEEEMADHHRSCFGSSRVGLMAGSMSLTHTISVSTRSEADHGFHSQSHQWPTPLVQLEPD